MDLREVNKAVIPDKYPLPTVDELAGQFHSSKMFSKLDLSQGYLQIPLTEKGRNVTAFISHDGVFPFKRMPFGLSSAPSAFQKIMVSTLAGLKGVSVCMHDIVVHGATQEEHDRRLSAGLDCLQKHNVTLNNTKCVFGSNEVQFLGFRVSGDGIQPIQSNVDSISTIPASTTVKEVRSFLWMAKYYLKFIPQYATITAPMRNLLKKDSDWNWTEHCQAAFEKVKASLTTSPVLSRFYLWHRQS